MEQEDKERKAARKAEAVDRIAMLIYGISFAGPKGGIAPSKAYEAATQFVDYVEKRDPDSDFRSF